MSQKQRTIVRFSKDGQVEGQPAQLEFQTTGIAFNQIGCIVLMDGEQAIGMFPLPSVAAVYHPDGANLVQGIRGSLIQ